MIQSIVIVGVGLIGGSLGLAWRKQNANLEIVGYDDPGVLERALSLGAISEKASDLQTAVAGADVVVLAVPIRKVRRLLDEIAPAVRPSTIVTDVCSVKAPILQYALDALPRGARFVAGHPMAGAEKGGVENANAFLFENATYVLCPPDEQAARTFDQDYKEFIDLIQLTGARVLVMDAERHDRIAANISHLPQLLAVVLMNHAATLNHEDDAFLRLAAGGFRDMTRIASSPFDLWQDILLVNEDRILDALSQFAASLQVIRNRLIERDYEDIGKAFEKARKVRDTIPRDSKGFLHPLADVYVYAEDRPGELLTITRTLYEEEINIKDIELLKIREGAGGAFRLSFSNDAVANAAVVALKAAGYTAYRL
jgi:prephenate dehydrogenase